MEATIFLSGIVETVSEFVNSNVIAVFLIAVGVIIMCAVLYGVKLWYETRELKKSLDSMDADFDEQLSRKDLEGFC